MHSGSQYRSSAACGSVAMPKSTSPLRTLCSTDSCERSFRWIAIAGHACRQPASHAGTDIELSTGSDAICTSPWHGRLALWLSRSVCSTSSIRWQMRCDRCRPASVSSTWRVVRSNRRWSISSSSSRTLRLTADCVRPSSAAARVKLLCRATAAKAFSWGSEMFMAALPGTRRRGSGAARGRARRDVAVRTPMHAVRSWQSP
ncbi:hypothetical protein D3C81_1342740 [compost metagenome]